MLRHTKRLDLDEAIGGLEVKPSAAHLPFRLSTAAGSPEKALGEAHRRLAALREAAAAQVRMIGHRAWTEKLAGGVLGVGVRHHTEVTGVVCLELPFEDDYLARVAAVEALRGRLAPFDKDGAVVGEVRYVVEDPESHRPAVVAALRAQATAMAEALDLPLTGFSSPMDLRVEVVGPAQARVLLEAHVAFGGLVAVDEAKAR